MKIFFGYIFIKVIIYAKSTHIYVKNHAKNFQAMYLKFLLSLIKKNTVYERKRNI